MFKTICKWLGFTAWMVLVYACVQVAGQVGGWVGEVGLLGFFAGCFMWTAYEIKRLARA